MSLSPLNPSSASDLHVNNARDLPLDFRPTSINSGIDHILSGFNTCVKPLIHLLRVAALFYHHLHYTIPVKPAYIYTNVKLLGSCYKTSDTYVCKDGYLDTFELVI